MRVKAKICGIRDIESTSACVAAGVDFIGLNFVPGYKRYISPRAAKKIADAVRSKLAVVGIFMNEELDKINTIVDTVELDYVQLHGDETPAYCRQVNARVIKAYGMETDFNFAETVEYMQQYPVEIHLIDRKERGKGKMLDLHKARKLSEQFKLMFAGGLTPDNVGEVVRKVSPYAVDVSSGVETEGRKDLVKIKEFVQEAKKHVA